MLYWPGRQWQFPLVCQARDHIVQKPQTAQRDNPWLRLSFYRQQSEEQVVANSHRQV